MPSPPAPSPLEGVIPKHATCTACGYDISGIPISQGIILCPECGTNVPFDFPPRPPTPPSRGSLRRNTFIVLIAVAIIITANSVGWLSVALGLLSLWLVHFVLQTLRRSVFKDATPN